MPTTDRIFRRLIDKIAARKEITDLEEIGAGVPNLPQVWNGDVIWCSERFRRCLSAMFYDQLAGGSRSEYDTN